MRYIVSMLILLGVTTCQDPTVQEIGQRATGIGDLVNEYWDYQLKEFPLMASFFRG